MKHKDKARFFKCPACRSEHWFAPVDGVPASPGNRPCPECGTQMEWRHRIPADLDATEKGLLLWLTKRLRRRAPEALRECVRLAARQIVAAEGKPVPPWLAQAIATHSPVLTVEKSESTERGRIATLLPQSTPPVKSYFEK